MNSLKYLLFISVIGFAGCKKTIVNDCAKDDHVDPRDTLMFPNDSTGELEMGIFDRTEILENLKFALKGSPSCSSISLFCSFSNVTTPSATPSYVTASLETLEYWPIVLFET